ncbi:MAG: aspartate dehydrogenase domain-containing protein [Alistipes sp.]|nr:aspartate dehydrogenase domain-containing protein [Alistipes sp.]
MKRRVVIVGCGRLAGVVAYAYNSGLLSGYEIVGVLSRTYAHAEQMAEAVGGDCKACHSLDELLELKPDYLLEMANPKAMRDIVIPTLQSGCSIVTLSIGAFADDELYEEVKRVASASGSKVYIASGATGGFDILRTATLMGGATARFFNEKSPRGLVGTEVYDDSLRYEQRVVFEGTAKQAIEKFPTRVNVTVAASRASVGPENMKVMMQSSPYFVGDTQRVEIRNPQVHAVVDIYSATPEIAGWSVVAVLRNILSPIVF